MARASKPGMLAITLSLRGELIIQVEFKQVHVIHDGVMIGLPLLLVNGADVVAEGVVDAIAGGDGESVQKSVPAEWRSLDSLVGSRPEMTGWESGPRRNPVRARRVAHEERDKQRGRRQPRVRNRSIFICFLQIKELELTSKYPLGERTKDGKTAEESS